MKTCSKCGIVKSDAEFHKRANTRCGLQPQYKICKKTYQSEHKGRKRKYDQRRYFDNPEFYKIKSRIYEKKMLKESVEYKLKFNLRKRLNSAVRNSYKSGSAVRDLGCSIEKLKRHLESQFQEGMSWENYGQWHIDHIKPLSAFDLSNRK